MTNFQAALLAAATFCATAQVPSSDEVMDLARDWAAELDGQDWAVARQDEDAAAAAPPWDIELAPGQTWEDVR